MKEQARDTMIRDKFIASQRQCALRRQLDGFAQGTPIGEIVDSCLVWESYSDLNRVSTVNCSFRNKRGIIPIPGHAVRTVQCPSYVRTTYGPCVVWNALVPLSCVFG